MRISENVCRACWGNEPKKEDYWHTWGCPDKAVPEKYRREEMRVIVSPVSSVPDFCPKKFEHAIANTINADKERWR